MRNKKKMFRSCLCLFAMLLLCGCSLAVPDAGGDRGGDQMIGVFITTEFLDLFTMEDAAAFGNEGRLYAEIDKSRGADPIDWEISFGNLDGFQLLTPLWTMENGENCWGNVCSEEVSDTDIRLNVADDSRERSLSGTVYVLQKRNGNRAYYANPVYQTADGRIYAVQGHGVSTSGESAEGMRFSSELSAETTITENGKTKAEKSSVSIEYAVMSEPVQIRVYQMDPEHRVIRQDDLKPEEVPEELAVEKDAEYILTEVEKEGLTGEKIVDREVYGYRADEETYLTTFCARADGILVKQGTRLLWSR